MRPLFLWCNIANPTSGTTINPNESATSERAWNTLLTRVCQQDNKQVESDWFSFELPWLPQAALLIRKMPTILNAA